MRPDDIPEDVWGKADALAMQFVEWIDPSVVEGVASAEYVLTQTIARAIMAERERCAEVAEDDRAPYFELRHSIARETAIAIAAAIRGTL